MRLIRSETALLASLALAASRDLTLTEIARALDVPSSAAQRALEILAADGIAGRVGEPRPRYRLAASAAARHVVTLAMTITPIDDALRIAGRANGAIEFVGREGNALTVVFAATSASRDQSPAARYVDLLASIHGYVVRYQDHDDARRDTLADPTLRDRIARGAIIHGDLDRAYPDRQRHRVVIGEPLHAPHPSVRLPSIRALRKLARQHGVESMRLFGSAVRDDFRPDSDIDIAVTFETAVRPTLRGLDDLEHALETAFGRDVDLVIEDVLLTEVSATIEREAVALT